MTQRATPRAVPRDTVGCRDRRPDAAVPRGPVGPVLDESSVHSQIPCELIQPNWCYCGLITRSEVSGVSLVHGPIGCVLAQPFVRWSDAAPPQVDRTGFRWCWAALVAWVARAAAAVDLDLAVGAAGVV